MLLATVVVVVLTAIADADADAVVEVDISTDEVEEIAVDDELMISSGGKAWNVSLL